MVKKFIGVTGVQLLGKLITIFLGVILARRLGAEEYGLYGYCISLLTLFSVPVVAGLPNLVTRELSFFKVKNDGERFYGVIKWSNRYLFVSSFFCIIGFYIALQSGIIGEGLAFTLFVFCIIIPLKGVVIRQSAIVNACKHPALAQSFIQLIFPSVVLTSVILTIILGYEITVVWVLGFSTLGYFISLIVSLFSSGWVINKLRIKKSDVIYDSRVLMKSMLPFSIMAIISTFNIEVASVILGEMRETSEVAYFKVAMQAVSIIIIGLNSINSILMPDIASLYKSNELDKLQRLLKRGVRINTLFALPTLVILVIVGRYLIEVLFGHDYTGAYIVLVVLCFGQAFNVCMGSVGLVLNMTNNEKCTLNSSIFAVILNFILLYLLVPYYGAIGAAIATSITIMMINVVNTIQLRKVLNLKLHIH